VTLTSVAPYAAVIAAALTASLGLYWNFHSATAARKQTFLLRQMDLCFEASECVATLATTSSNVVWEAARDRFWQLYYGCLAVVEGEEVAKWMVASSKLVPPTGKAPSLPVSELCGPSLQLSHAVRGLFLEAWSIQSLKVVLQGNAQAFEEGRQPGFFETVRKTYREEFERQMKKG
jgi:hypothetical protein